MRNVVAIDYQRAAVEHNHTYYTRTHMYSPYEHVTNGDFPPLLWEKTGELSDGCLIQALV